MASVYVSLVTFNSLAQHGSACLDRCIRSVLSQKGYRPGLDLFLHVRDNASNDGLPEWLQARFPLGGVRLHRGAVNLGFAAANNEAAAEFLASEAQYLLLINPDLALEPEALGELVRQLEECPEAGTACPRLYRADADLNPLRPPQIDAAGMWISSALRHLDRGSGMPDGPEYQCGGFVFGGSGACLILRRAFVEDFQMDGGAAEASLYRVYPELLAGRELRKPLFDEAFFAYREDADLAWRAQLLGWKCLYVPKAVGCHRRVVLPDRRRELAAAVNLGGVRNRFLLQLNNFFLPYAYPALLPGVIFRNLIVSAGVLLRERSSLPAFGQTIKLMPRARARRKALRARVKIKPAEMAEWLTRGDALRPR